MKIVDVCAFYSPHGGGVKTYVERKLAVGPSLGHEITLIVPSDRDAVEIVGPSARIVHVASPQLIVDRRYRYFAAAAPIHSILDREQPDFIEASSPWRTASIVADWKGSAPRSLVMHADPLSTYAYRWFGPIASRDAIDRQFEFFWKHLRRVGQKYDMTIAANDDLANRLAAGGLPRVVTLPMGIDPGLFSPSRRDPDLRRTLLARCGLPETATLLLGIGRHSAEKRWNMVIDATLAASNYSPIGLILIGDGRHRTQLARHVRGNPHIHLLAPISDRAMLANVLASGDALIHGCETETFGLVAAEAAASGLPLIVPDEGGSTAVVRLGSGVTYKAGDALAAADAITGIIANGLSQTRQRAFMRAQQIPSIDEHFAELFNRYEGARRLTLQAA
jgi:alpha-1,6-mannosyltransferase